MSLRCVNCNAVFVDRWNTDNTAHMQTPACPHCGWEWYEDTEDSIRPPKQHYVCKNVVPAAQTEADRQVYWMNWLEQHGIVEDALLFAKSRDMARYEAQGHPLNARYILRRTRWVQEDSRAAANVPLFPTEDSILETVSVEEAEQLAILKQVCDAVWAETSSAGGRPVKYKDTGWQEALDLEWADCKTEEQRNYYKAISMRLSRFRRKLVEMGVGW